MPLLDKIDFSGFLIGHGSKVAINFTAEISDEGRLLIQIEPLPVSKEAIDLRVNQTPGDEVDLITIEGNSEEGHRFFSDSFNITSFKHSSEEGKELTYQGNCFEANISMPPLKERGSDSAARVWRVPKLQTFRRLQHTTSIGRVIIGGAKDARNTQNPGSFLAVYMPDDADKQDWDKESRKFLEHLARILSFACDSYLMPVIEERYDGSALDIRVFRRSRTASPFRQPFHYLTFQEIFDCACESYFSNHEAALELDATIRWMTAQIAYDENRLLNAMSAIECILDRSEIDGLNTYFGAAKFNKLAKKVRKILRELNVPDEMLQKVAELNRKSLSERVLALVDAEDIPAHDFPDQWLAEIIKQRNHIVHRGVSSNTDGDEPDVLDHAIWARELVTRVILKRIGFEGGYRSWLHSDEMLRFPECIPMEQWVQMQ